MSTALQIQERREQAMPARQTLEPNNIKDAWEFSEIIAKSDLAPKDYRGKPANVLVAIQFGKELGVPPMQALQGIAVVNGRPAVWGDLMWALVTNHPEFEDSEEQVTEDRATVTLHRRGRKPVTDTFTLGDAKVAGLLGNAVWKTYPKRMLLWRARTFAARTLFPDALKGMISVEEAGDYDGGMTISGAIAPTSSPHVDAAAGSGPVVSQDQARDFGKAWKASGYTMEEAKAWLKSNLNLESSLKIPASRIEEAMKWANTAKGAAPAESSAPASTAQDAQQLMSLDEKKCREAFSLLDWNLAEQAEAIERHKTDWAALLIELNKKLEARDAE